MKGLLSVFIATYHYRANKVKHSPVAAVASFTLRSSAQGSQSSRKTMVAQIHLPTMHMAMLEAGG